MIYTINWLEIKTTSTGKTKANVNLLDDTGVETSDVTIWSDFPDFANLRPGSKVDGTLVSKNIKGKIWTSLTAAKNPNGTFRPTPKVLSNAEITHKSVEQAQFRKEDSIRTSSTFRDATTLTVMWRKERLARGINTTAEEWQDEWKNVRSWLDKKFDEPF